MTPSTTTGGLTHRQILTVLSGLMLGMFLASLDQTIVSTAMRTIADELHGQTQQAWVTTAYLVTSTVSTPLYGKLSDLYGRKPFYLFAISIFVVGSMLCGFANSIYELAAYRALQGIGAGGLMSLAFAIVGDMVSPRERGRYQGYFMSVFATSSVLGPVLGGWFAGQASIAGIDGWRWIFYINVPIGLLALLVVSRVLQRPSTRSEHRIDYLGAALLTSAVVPVLLLAEKGHEWGWTSSTSMVLLAIALVSLGLFIPRERHMGEEAILPLRVFANRVFTVSSTVAFLVGIGMFGGLMSMPLYLQIVNGESPTRAGLQMIPFMVGIICSSFVTGRIMSRTGRYKIFPIIGTAIMAVAMLLFSTLGVDTPIARTMSFMVVMGIGLGLSMQTLVISVQNALPPRDMGIATSSVTFFRSMGGTFGVAAALSVLFGSVTGNIKDRALEARLPLGDITRFTAAGGLDDTSKIARLPERYQQVVIAGFADSMHTVFLTTFFLLIPAFVLTFFIKELPLRSMGGMAAARAEAEKRSSAEVEADTAKAETAVL
ncbi:MAG: MFS transporter [Frankiaceae bacterium]|nr:MFS transporter [Frankiaceae bacterium]